jgi:hypothetical protein
VLTLENRPTAKDERKTRETKKNHFIFLGTPQPLQFCFPMESTPDQDGAKVSEPFIGVLVNVQIGIGLHLSPLRKPVPLSVSISIPDPACLSSAVCWMLSCLWRIVSLENMTDRRGDSLPPYFRFGDIWFFHSESIRGARTNNVATTIILNNACNAI